jgi:hypothetical protein
MKKGFLLIQIIFLISLILPTNVDASKKQSSDQRLIRLRMEESLKKTDQQGNLKPSTFANMTDYMNEYLRTKTPDCLRYVNDVYPIDYHGPTLQVDNSGKLVVIPFNPMAGKIKQPKGYPSIKAYKIAMADAHFKEVNAAWHEIAKNPPKIGNVAVLSIPTQTEFAEYNQESTNQDNSEIVELRSYLPSINSSSSDNGGFSQTIELVNPPSQPSPKNLSFQKTLLEPNSSVPVQSDPPNPALNNQPIIILVIANPGDLSKIDLTQIVKQLNSSNN